MAFSEKKSHPNHRLAKWLVIGAAIFVGAGLLLAVFVPMTYSIFFQPLADMEHYRQVWQTPVTVSAIVTDHGSYDDDGDTDYTSYITYAYEDTYYVDFLYEDRDKKESLTPLGTTVTIQISPLDPSKQLSHLKHNGSRAPFVCILLFAGLAGISVLLHRSSLSKKCRGIPDTDTLRKDIQAKIRSRFWRPFLLLCWLGCSFLYWRYSVVLGAQPLVLAGISGTGWIYCIYTSIRDYRWVENGDFELHRDVLVNKIEGEDEDRSTYWLFYQCGEKSWKTKVKADTYFRAQIGDTVVAAYLPGKKKPIIHYNADGNAQ